MLKLMQFPPFWGLPNASIFCMKLETYLRMTKIPFEIIKIRDPRKTPKGKVPYIDDDGYVLSDSGLIIAYLKNKYGDSLDADLTPLQKAQALMMQRMVDEHLYWGIFYSRWIDPVNWPVTQRDIFGRLPFWLRGIVPNLIRKRMRAEVYNQGLGRNTQAEVYQLCLDDLRALSTILGEQPFVLGEQPTSIDATAYAGIANVLYPPIESPLREYAKTQKNFSAYCQRMQEKYY